MSSVSFWVSGVCARAAEAHSIPATPHGTHNFLFTCASWRATLPPPRAPAAPLNGGTPCAIGSTPSFSIYGGFMRAIFISYRREDSEGQAGRLFTDLGRIFGPQ